MFHLLIKIVHCNKSFSNERLFGDASEMSFSLRCHPFSHLYTRCFYSSVKPMSWLMAAIKSNFVDSL